MASTVTHTALEPFAAVIGGRIMQLARTDPRVRNRLAGVRSRVVTVDAGEHEVGFYDYDNDVLVVAVLDPLTGGLVDLTERKESPPITLEELAELQELLAALPRRTSEFLARYGDGLRV
jgi:hypothetical protein